MGKTATTSVQAVFLVPNRRSVSSQTIRSEESQPGYVPEEVFNDIKTTDVCRGTSQSHSPLKDEVSESFDLNYYETLWLYFYQ